MLCLWSIDINVELLWTETFQSTSVLTLTSLSFLFSSSIKFIEALSTGKCSENKLRSLQKSKIEIFAKGRENYISFTHHNHLSVFLASSSFLLILHPHTLVFNPVQCRYASGKKHKQIQNRKHGWATCTPIASLLSPCRFRQNILPHGWNDELW